MEDLIASESQQADGLATTVVPPRTPTPVVVTSLLPALRLHPDQRFVEYIWNRLLAGFHVGFSKRCPLQALHRNHPWATQHPEVVWEHIRSELQRGSLVGPLHPSLAAQVHTSPIGWIN